MLPLFLIVFGIATGLQIQLTLSDFTQVTVDCDPSTTTAQGLRQILKNAPHKISSAEADSLAICSPNGWTSSSAEIKETEVLETKGVAGGYLWSRGFVILPQYWAKVYDTFTNRERVVTACRTSTFGQILNRHKHAYPLGVNLKSEVDETKFVNSNYLGTTLTDTSSLTKIKYTPNCVNNNDFIVLHEVGWVKSASKDNSGWSIKNFDKAEHVLMQVVSDNQPVQQIVDEFSKQIKNINNTRTIKISEVVSLFDTAGNLILNSGNIVQKRDAHLKNTVLWGLILDESKLLEVAVGQTENDVSRKISIQNQVEKSNVDILDNSGKSITQFDEFFSPQNNSKVMYTSGTLTTLPIKLVESKSLTKKPTLSTRIIAYWQSMSTSYQIAVTMSAAVIFGSLIGLCYMWVQDSIEEREIERALAAQNQEDEERKIKRLAGLVGISTESLQEEFEDEWRKKFIAENADPA